MSSHSFPSARSLAPNALPRRPHQTEQIVVEIAWGESMHREVVFERHMPVPLLTIGTAGMWRVQAPFVLPVHVALAFNGQALFASAPPASAGQDAAKKDEPKK